jgi:hypothetical protein
MNNTDKIKLNKLGKKAAINFWMSAFCLTGVVTILAKSALAGLLFLAGWSLLIFSFLSIIEYYRVKILKDLFDKTP